ncbi:hypothetical protein [Actinoplanes solisilvae]|uniref:hypothetical protein n=1 Tax=Actinoplanes solisilvae TaxID=2486853 RepID=UPI000FDC2522|nr:hypothetical protein [Actinoplanes solisilvae]
MTSLSYPVPSPKAVSATATAFVLAFSVGALASFAFLGLSAYVAPLLGGAVAVLAFAATLSLTRKLVDPGQTRPRTPAAPGTVPSRIPAAPATARPLVPTVLQGSAIIAVLIAGNISAGSGAAAGLLVIALSAAALALQAAGTRRIIELAGVTTSVPHDFAGRRDSHLWLRLGSIPTLVAGAIVGTAVVVAAPAVALLTSALAAIAAVTLVRRVDVHRL